MRFGFFWSVTLLFSMIVGPILGQDAPEKTEPVKKEVPAAEEKPAEEKQPNAETKPALSKEAEAFSKVFKEWKVLLAELKSLQIEYRSTNDDKRKSEIEKEFDEKLEKGKKLEVEISALAEAAYKAHPKEFKTVENFIAGLANANLKRDQYEKAANLAKLLIENGMKVSQVYKVAGIAAFVNSDFPNAKKYLELAGKADAEVQEKLDAIPARSKLWEAELAAREKDAKSGDLPRVKLETDRGDIVIELFENEAPNTVANFINLVEAKFYDGLTFHRVLPQFMAQGGCPEGSGRGGPGYNIPDECKEENARMHFRGSVSMAHAGANTGGSQFFIMYEVSPHLDKLHTVFGRVIEGIENASDLERIDPQDTRGGTPSKILKATVLRKRDHKYAVKTSDGGTVISFDKTGGKVSLEKDGDKKDPAETDPKEKDPADKKEPTKEDPKADDKKPEEKDKPADKEKKSDEDK
jgi:cyclophilin family peptidyl-prolyl cis-trans isomerase